ncbi:MAG: hypothetical protein ACYCZ6_08230 [Polaromonas sp.]
MREIFRLGRTHVAATITKMAAKDAEWRAAQANLTHGAALKPKERRTAFDRFIATGQHKKYGGGIESYRGMAEAFGGGASYGTIRNWIKVDHPAIFKALSGGPKGAWDSSTTTQVVKVTPEQEDLQSIHTLCQQAVAQSRGLTTTAGRAQAQAMLREAIVAIDKQLPYTVLPVVAPFPY